jgi:hypothetical protein
MSDYSKPIDSLTGFCYDNVSGHVIAHIIPTHSL